MSGNGLLGSLGAVALPLLGATLVGAPSAFADAGIGLSSVPVSLPLPVVGTVPATFPAPPAVEPTVEAAVPVIESDDVPAAVVSPTVAAPRTKPVTAAPSQVRHPQALARISHRRHAAVSVSQASPASQAARRPVIRDRRVPTPPIPDRTVTGLSGGSAGAAGAGFVLLLLAVAATVLAVVRPRLGKRTTSLLRVPHPAVLALELERPD
jgi:hypothetical protein